jgi:hypothetical protein
VTPWAPLGENRTRTRTSALASEGGLDYFHTAAAVVDVGAEHCEADDRCLRDKGSLMEGGISGGYYCGECRTYGAARATEMMERMTVEERIVK